MIATCIIIMDRYASVINLMADSLYSDLTQLHLGKSIKEMIPELQESVSFL